MSIFNHAAYWLSWPIVYMVLNNTRRTRVIIRHKNEILLVKPRLNLNSWDLPGGGIRKGEDESRAACREVHEELGIELAPKDLDKLGERHIVKQGIRITAVVFTIDLLEKPPIKLQKKELTGAAWHTVSQLSTLKQSHGLTEVLSFAALP